MNGSQTTTPPQTTQAPIEKFLAALQGADCRPRWVGSSGWKAHCPAHEDAHPSLTIRDGDNGAVLATCHAGCSIEQIADALGLAVRDLFPPKPRAAERRSKRRSSGKPTRRPSQSSFETPDAALAVLAAKLGEPAARWTYQDAQGEAIAVVARWDTPDGKQIRPVSRNGDGWKIGAPGEPRPLYGLPKLADAECVYIVEGEKCADALADVGVTGTTSMGGANAPAKTDWTPLAGRDVVILPDADHAGRGYAEAVAAELTKLDPPATVRIVELPDLPDGGGADVADWIGADGPMGERAAGEIRDRLEALAGEAPECGPDPVPGARTPMTARLADVTPEPVRWLWPGRIPRGKLTMLAGDPGLGKSFITLDLASRTSTGAGWPDRPGEPGDAPGGVVLLSAEDDVADTIRPRLDAAGADVTRIIALNAVRRYDAEAGWTEANFSLAADLAALEQAIAQEGNCRLVIIDPISAYLGGTDSHKNADTRGLLAPLAKLAAKHDVAIVAVTHLRKGEGPAVYRTMGSLAFVAAARAAFAVMPDQEDDSGRRRLFLPVKQNLAADVGGLAYHLGTGGHAQPVVHWHADAVTISADEALAPRRGPDPDARQEAEEWLTAALADGPRPASELKAEAKETGIAEKTLKRAKKALRVTSLRVGYGEKGSFSWAMPAAGSAGEAENYEN